MHMIEGRIHEFIINFYFIDDMCVLYIDALLALAHTAHRYRRYTCSTMCGTRSCVYTRSFVVVLIIMKF